MAISRMSVMLKECQCPAHTDCNPSVFFFLQLVRTNTSCSGGKCSVLGCPPPPLTSPLFFCLEGPPPFFFVVNLSRPQSRSNCVPACAQDSFQRLNPFFHSHQEVVIQTTTSTPPPCENIVYFLHTSRHTWSLEVSFFEPTALNIQPDVRCFFEVS